MIFSGLYLICTPDMWLTILLAVKVLFVLRFILPLSKREVGIPEREYEKYQKYESMKVKIKNHL